MIPSRWVFISPHLDDAALSCGGLMAHLNSNGVACVNITLTTGIPVLKANSDLIKEIQAEWGISDPAEAVAARKNEDSAAMRVLGCASNHLDFLDAIYRQDQAGNFLYSSIFDPIHPLETDFHTRIAESIKPLLQPGDQLVFPLAVGKHIDHLLTHAAASAFGNEVLYYIDVPYCFTQDNEVDTAINGFERVHLGFSEQSARSWTEAILCYPSQLSSLFDDERDMVTKIFEYFSRNEGILLFRKHIT